MSALIMVPSFHSDVQESVVDEAGFCEPGCYERFANKDTPVTVTATACEAAIPVRNDAVTGQSSYEQVGPPANSAKTNTAASMSGNVFPGSRYHSPAGAVSRR